MTQTMPNPTLQRTITKIKTCAKSVYKELGPGWPEKIYQQAMEVALREKRISYEDQRILPITFKGHIIGEGIPDLVIWVEKGKKRTAIVIDLKTEPYVKEEHRSQVRKYIRELRKQVKSNEGIHDTGLVINFMKEKSPKIEEEAEELDGVQILNVKV